MAYEFNGTTQYLSVASNPATLPFTLYGKAITTSATADATILALGLSSVTNGGTYRIYFNGSGASDPVAMQISNASFAYQANSSSSFSTSVWQDVVGSAVATNSRTVWLNGANKGTQTDNATEQTRDRIGIGALVRSNVIGYLPGQAAEIAIWEVALTDAEVTSLSKGFKPHRVRPQSLIFYAPLVRNIQDVSGALAITNNNTATVANHPRVY